MQRKLILLIVFFCWASLGVGQQIIQKTFSNANPNGMLKSQDGGYFIYGAYGSQPNGSALITKIDSIGNQQWSKLYTDTFNFSQIVKMANFGNGNLVAIVVSIESGVVTYSVLKTDPNGAIISSKAFNGTRVYGWADLTVDTNDNVILCGASYKLGGNSLDSSTFAIMKLDNSLNVIWAREYQYDYQDNFTSIALANDGNYILQGITQHTTGNSDIEVFKIDTSGNVIWAKQCGNFVTGSGMGNGIDVVRSGKILCSSNGEIINAFSCYWYSNNFGTDALIQKLDSAGDEIMAHQFGNDWRGSEGISTIAENTDSTLLFTTGLFFIKCNYSLNIIWRRISNWNISKIGSSLSILKNASNGYLGVSGYIDNKVYFSIVDSLGFAGCGSIPVGAFFDQLVSVGSYDISNLISHVIYPVSNNYSFSSSVITLNDSTICQTATSYADYANVKLSFEVFPTITNQFINIDYAGFFQQEVYLKIFSTTGQLMMDKNYQSLTSLKLDLSELSSGFYILQIKSSDHTNSVKIIKR